VDNAEVLCHPFIIGELACGTLKNRAEVLDLLHALPEVSVAEHDEVMKFLNEKKLFGHGLGWIDLYLLAFAYLSRATLWTTDRALRAVADELKR
jgi:predicted nucleic acid-binding protein